MTKALIDNSAFSWIPVSELRIIKSHYKTLLIQSLDGTELLLMAADVQGRHCCLAVSYHCLHGCIITAKYTAKN